MWEPQFNLEEKNYPSIWKDDFNSKNRTIHFHINGTSVSPVKLNELSFSSIEITKPLPAPIHSVLQIRFKFRNQF